MPVLHLLAGPNAAGKTTFYEHLLYPATRLPFINADLIAKREWPGDEEAHGHEASALAAQARNAAMEAGTSFIGETVFSHVSKLDLIERAKAAGYGVTLHVFIVPEELSVVRARLRSGQGGHSVPEDVLRARYKRLWALIEKAIPLVDEAFIYDNSSARKPFRLVAQYQDGVSLGAATWPSWSPLR
ncbi:MAG: ATPase [Rhizobium sp.]|nr:MAG: ATPase [Rhizobium sp.]